MSTSRTEIMKISYAGLLLIAAVAFPAAGTSQEQPPVYSNSDIEKFRLPSDSHTDSPKKEIKDERKTDVHTTKNNIEGERWCKRTAAQKNKIEKAEYEVQEAEKRLTQEEEKPLHSSKKIKQLQDKLRLAKRKLAGEEKKLTDIENEAHRKGVPPGWLRCQVD